MNYNGLNDKEVVLNRKKYGSNKLSSKNCESFWSLFIETLGDPIIKILLIALAIKIILLFKSFDWYETIGIILAILVASLISSISEYGSAKAFNRLQESSSKIKCIVKRNGQKQSIWEDEIVYGDIVILNEGDKIVADGILIEGSIAVDESSMNGESKEKYKEKALYPPKYDERNFLYKSTTVVSGMGTMLVMNVGDNTFYGKLAQEVTEKSDPSPLKIRLGKLAKVISYIGYVAAILVSVSYLFNMIVINNDFNRDLIIETISNFPIMIGYLLQALTLSVTIIVVCVPEGLPMMITLVLSSNMKRMLKNNVLVRKLVGIETSGSLNLLFTDKTGTLTKGNLEVIGYLLGNCKTYASLSETKSKYTNILVDSIVYNNQSYYNVNKEKAYGGNSTDRALLEYIKKNKSGEVKIINNVPFNSKNKYSMAIIEKNKDRIKLVKGAPEIIINSCSKYLDENGNSLPLNRRKILDEVNKYTKKGMRLIALSIMDSSYNIEYMKNMTLIGVMFIKDELRKEAFSSIEMIKRAGIQTVMITGDNLNTAIEIAKELKIINNATDQALTSEDINKLTDEELKGIMPNIRVIARALPTDKSRLVKIAKELNLVVGMTGDGVNDAPALKRADIGFSMGSGTEVAKEASDIVILDDNINSIANAILYGRTIFKSIRKFIICQLTINLCALSVSIVGPFIGIPVPVTVIQMLWINMVMDTLAGLAFSYEPPLSEYMEEKPKDKDEFIINKYMLNQILVTGIYSSILCILFLKSSLIKSFFRIGLNNEYILTAFFGLFIFIGIFNSFNARTHRLNIFANILKNKVFLIVICFIIFVQISLIYYGGTLFRTSGLLLKEFIVMLLLASTVIPIEFFRKIILKFFKQDLGV